MRVSPEELKRLEADRWLMFADAPSLGMVESLSTGTKFPIIKDGNGNEYVGKPVKIQPKDPFARMRTKLERDYANHLEMLRRAGEIDRWEYEWANFLLADDEGNFIRYLPDFALFKGDTLRFVEAKGYWYVNGLLKFKLARCQLPFKLVAVRKIKGVWTYTEHPSRDEYKSERIKRKAEGGSL